MFNKQEKEMQDYYNNSDAWIKAMNSYESRSLFGHTVVWELILTIN